MELMDGKAIYIGLGVVALLLLIYLGIRKKKGNFKEGLRVLSINYIEDNPYYKHIKIRYKILRVVAFAVVLCTILSSFFLISRPYDEEKYVIQKYRRDIMICLDISSSVDEVNKKLLDELIAVIDELEGDRIGVIMFNTSAVLISPLTEDYQYVKDEMELLKKGLEARIKYLDNQSLSAEEEYYMNYIENGTLVGCEERGSSLIGDGLAAAAYSFSDEEDTTKIIIFTSDNEAYGEEYVDLPEAGELCSKKNITVFGIGTNEMLSSDRKEMERTVTKTGGKFYLEGDKNTFKDMVDDIQKISRGLADEESFYIKHDTPKVAFLILLLTSGVMFITMKLLRD